MLQIYYSSRIILAALDDNVVSTWVTYLHQAIVYANWVEQKLKEDLNQFDRSSIFEVNLKSDIANQPNEEVILKDQDRNFQTPAKKPKTKNSTDVSSEKEVSPKILSAAMPKTAAFLRSPNELASSRWRAGTDFKMEIEETKNEHMLKSDVSRTQTTMFTDSELKFDDKITFQSFEIIKMIGSGAFGKVYKVKLKHIVKIIRS